MESDLRAAQALALIMVAFAFALLLLLRRMIREAEHA
jgi:ABC-type sulfate transport system permease component